MKAVELLSIDPFSKEVKTLYEVFSWGREALGEYLYHAEIDVKSVKDDGTGDLNSAEYYASVEVSFERDVLDVAKYDISRSPALLIAPSIESIRGVTPNELMKISLVAEEFFISGGNKHCFIMRIIDWGTVGFVRYAVEEGRTTKIEVVGRGIDITVSELYEAVNKLVERYQNIPLNRFSGAVRD